MWRKLIRNAATNVVSALTGATLEQLGHDEEAVRLVTEIALEVGGLAARLRRSIDPELEQLIDVLKYAGPFATSMLQDVRHGREPELAAIAEAPLELAAMVGHPMPTLRAAATPWLSCRTTRMRAIASRMAPDRSVDPSSTATTSSGA